MDNVRNMDFVRPAGCEFLRCPSCGEDSVATNKVLILKTPDNDNVPVKASICGTCLDIMADTLKCINVELFEYKKEDTHCKVLNFKSKV